VTTKKRLSDEDELDLRCSLADKSPCIYRRFLLGQLWVIEQRCPTCELAKKEFDKILAEREHEKYRKEYPDEN